MSSLELSRRAKEDLDNIAKYTVKTWGLRVMNTNSCRQKNSQNSQDSIFPLDPNKVYEVWTPIEAPEAAKTLMSLLDAEPNMLKD